jgi:hypothetical protein
MKKQLTIIGFSALIITAVAFQNEKGQQEKNKNKKEQQQNPSNKQGKEGKENAGKNENKGKQGNKNEDHENHGNDDVKNNGQNEGHDNSGKKDDMGRNNNEMKDGFKWDRETFKDRKKYKNGEKVALCHKFNKEDEPAVTITVSSHAVKAHMNHGDVMGDCPAESNKRYSDVFLRNRTDYYNTIQNHYEQVSYSRSILDYALARLTNSRQQLVTMQNNNTPVAEIERKQATVVQLEQNVSLLETLVGVAANLVVNKLQN